MSETTMAFGTVLRRLRTAAGLSQEELAERAGLSRNGISDLERGLYQAPRFETVHLLADGLALAAEERATLLAAARPAVREQVPPGRRPRPLITLPVPLTRLIGREADLTALQDRLQDEGVRLLTLTGPSGVGKTRLAIEVASRLYETFPDGVVFVDLTPLSDPELVMPTVATALGVREVAERQIIESLSAFLAPKRLLLVLDNCEPILTAGTYLARLLATSPGLKILATSRAPFRVRGEREVPLLPLPLPIADRLSTLEELGQVPAIELFVERAEASRPDFTMTSENVAAVAAICQRLDGLPLAIELAAARVRVLPPQALVARLEHRLPLLAGGGRDLPARQRTMRDAIAWSYDLLSPDEQSLFRRLAVFAGGFTLDGAEAVAAPDVRLAVLDGLMALVEQSLVRQMPGTDDEPRYSMLETVREFGVERLASSGEADEARRRHAQYFLRLSADLAQGRTILTDQAILTRVVAEHDNVRLALAWFDEHGEIDGLLQLSSLLNGLWYGRGLYREGLQWVDRALEGSGHGTSAALVRALDGAGLLAILQGDNARGEKSLAKAEELARALGDPSLLGETLAYSAYLAYRRREFARAEGLLDEARPMLGGQADIAAGVGPILTLGGVVPFLTLGDLALAQGQLDRAAKQYAEAIELFRAAGSELGLRDMQAGLAAVRYLTGDLPEAAALYGESLQRSHALHLWAIVVSSLLGLAGIAVEAGQPEVGARVLGAAEGFARSLGSPIFTRDGPVYDRVLASVQLALSEERLAAAQKASRGLSIEAAIAEAQVVAETVASTAFASSG